LSSEHRNCALVESTQHAFLAALTPGAVLTTMLDRRSVSSLTQSGALAMPRIARKFVFDPDNEGVYHCINRCVRRAFLCGTDSVSRKCFDHRKEWLLARLAFLAGRFGIDVLGFAIMSNHLHVVVRNRPDVVREWSDDEVARRWLGLFPLGRDQGDPPKAPTQSALLTITANPARLAELRERLSDLSWFMRCLVEPIARQANREDQVSGSFWEGRFKSLPILDDSALAACLAYVDLNPIRAKVAETPETSQFTSVFERIQSLNSDSDRSQTQECTLPDHIPCVPAEPAMATAEALPVTPLDSASKHKSTSSKRIGSVWLSPFEVVENTASAPVPSARASNRGCLPMRFAEYRALLDWTALQLRLGNRDGVPCPPAPIPAGVKVTGEGWLRLVRDFSRLFRRAAGAPKSLRDHNIKWARRRMTGISHSRAIFI
jgi:REP element-mobilizing transposase RayT